VLTQRLPDGGIQNLPEGVFILKLDLRLGRVHVDVNGLRGHIQKQEIGGEGIGGQQFLIGLHDRLMEPGVAHVPAVDEEKLLSHGFAGIPGQPQVTAEGDQGSGALHGNQGLMHRFSEDVGDSFPEGSHRQVMQQGIVVVELKGDFRVGKGYPVYFGDDVFQFVTVRFEEFPACRDVEEEVFHLEGGAVGASCRFLGDYLCGGDTEVSAGFVFPSFGTEFHVGDGGDGSQGFAPESHGADGKEIAGVPDLGGGMPLKGHPCIDGGHPAAVVGDLDQGFPGILDMNEDLPRPCIHGILHQFLYHGSRPLDHFPCGNLVGHRIGQ